MARRPLLLSVPLIGSLDASFAVGDGRAHVDPRGSSPSFEDDGVRAGARFALDTCVTYAAEGNFNRHEGTVMLWYKPDWDAQQGFEDGLGRILWDLRIEHGSIVPDDPSQRWALVFPNPSGKGKGGRSDSTYGCWRLSIETNRNRYIIGTRQLRQDKRTRQAVFGSQQHFGAGEWMHLAVVWTRDAGIIWVNGREDARGELTEGLPDRPLPERTQLGAIPSWINAGACGTISDFRIYGKALEGQQIAQEAGLDIREA